MVNKRLVNKAQLIQLFTVCKPNKNGIFDDAIIINKDILKTLLDLVPEEDLLTLIREYEMSPRVMDEVTLGVWLTAIRQIKGIATQGELAKELNISQSEVSNLEQANDRMNLTLDKARKLISLGLSLLRKK